MVLTRYKQYVRGVASLLTICNDFGGLFIEKKERENSMGFWCSHNAWTGGGYILFNNFRKCVSALCGGSFPPHTEERFKQDIWYWNEKYSKKTHPGLYEFFSQSDGGGNIAPSICEKLAVEMEELLEELGRNGVVPGREDIFFSPMVLEKGGIETMMKKFIKGCRKAAKTKKKGACVWIGS